MIILGALAMLEVDQSLINLIWATDEDNELDVFIQGVKYRFTELDLIIIRITKKSIGMCQK